MNKDKPYFNFDDSELFKYEPVDEPLTKRERFAMAAMQGINSNPEFIEDSFEQIADFAVEQADALLKELEETDET